MSPWPDECSQVAPSCHQCAHDQAAVCMFQRLLLPLAFSHVSRQMWHSADNWCLDLFHALRSRWHRQVHPAWLSHQLLWDAFTAKQPLWSMRMYRNVGKARRRHGWILHLRDSRDSNFFIYSVCSPDIKESILQITSNNTLPWRTCTDLGLHRLLERSQFDQKIIFINGVSKDDTTYILIYETSLIKWNFVSASINQIISASSNNSAGFCLAGR